MQANSISLSEDPRPVYPDDGYDLQYRAVLEETEARRLLGQQCVGSLPSLDEESDDDPVWWERFIYRVA